MNYSLCEACNDIPLCHPEAKPRDLLEKRQEWNKRWEENQKGINSVLEEIKLLQRRHDIGASPARGGLRAEASFRDAMKGIVEESSPVYMPSEIQNSIISLCSSIHLTYCQLL
ncbi:DUF3782 domain-containing protein [Thermodesulfovibrio sp. 3907-1M]|uniref:DUF3782 domain-containing protein n=1 Tax=Thermodesulfovibrio autotrophicus TaxID=3118333 RepID=A0AAU8GU97_9BACT